MVYIYVCKRFKVTMEMISSKEGDWVNNKKHGNGIFTWVFGDRYEGNF